MLFQNLFLNLSLLNNVGGKIGSPKVEKLPTEIALMHILCAYDMDTCRGFNAGLRSLLHDAK